MSICAIADEVYVDVERTSKRQFKAVMKGEQLRRTCQVEAIHPSGKGVSDRAIPNVRVHEQCRWCNERCQTQPSVISPSTPLLPFFHLEMLLTTRTSSLSRTLVEQRHSIRTQHSLMWEHHRPGESTLLLIPRMMSSRHDRSRCRSRIVEEYTIKRVGFSLARPHWCGSCRCSNRLVGIRSWGR